MRYDREQIDYWMKEWEESDYSILIFCRDNVRITNCTKF